MFCLISTTRTLNFELVVLIVIHVGADKKFVILDPMALCDTCWLNADIMAVYHFNNKDNLNIITTLLKQCHNDNMKFII